MLMCAPETQSQRVSQPAPRSVGRNQSQDSVGHAVPLGLTVRPVARTEPRPNETAREKTPIRPSSGKRRLAVRWILACSKGLATLAIALVAILMAPGTWNYYVT